VRIVPGVSLSLLGQVDAGEVDMALLIRPPFALPPELGWQPLLREEVVLAMPAAMALAPWREVLAAQPFIRYDRASFGGRQVDRFLRKMHIAVRDTCELDELDAIVKLVEHGVGVAIVPQTAVYRRWPAGVRAIDLGHHTFHRDIGLVHRAR
ncbi:LysR substrate-binding domain-containing protein, partial [Enterobacter sp. DRP3]|nr:LysR substrate-binding domain-containing protein [Enterobacter sp. DRP3]